MGKKGKVRVKQKGGAGAANVNPLADLMQPPAEDMIMPPQRGDPNVSIPWPSSKCVCVCVCWIYWNWNVLCNFFLTWNFFW